MAWILQDLGALGHIIFWKGYKFCFSHANLQMKNSAWAKADESLKEKQWVRWSRANLRGVHYVPKVSPLSLDAGAKPQLQIRDAIEHC